jgi:hypothetical protein
MENPDIKQYHRPNIIVGAGDLLESSAMAG